MSHLPIKKKRKLREDEDEEAEWDGKDDEIVQVGGWEDNEDNEDNETEDEEGGGGVYVDDEAGEEGASDNEEESDYGWEEEQEAEEAEDDYDHTPIARESNKAERVIYRSFALSLLEQASRNPSWETEEMGRLAALVIRELDLVGKPAKVFDFLSRCSVGGHPMLLRRLMDEIQLSLSPEHYALLIHSQATRDSGFERGIAPVDRVLGLLDEACEQHLFQLSDRDTIAALADVFANTTGMDSRSLKRVCITLCSHAGSKRNCGNILGVFTQDLPTNAAVEYAHDIIQTDFFVDLRGNIKTLYKNLPDIGTQLQAHVEALWDVDGDGEIIDSETDENGNLAGFVVDDDDEEGGDKSREGDATEEEEEEEEEEEQG